MYAVFASLVALAHGLRHNMHNSSASILSREGAAAFTHGAPHGPNGAGQYYRKLFENHRLCIYDHYILPGTTVKWNNDRPTVRWQIYADVNMIPAPVFSEAGTVSEISNPRRDNVLRRDYVFEIVQSQPKYTESEVRRLLTDPEWPTDVGSNLFFENRFVRMWDFHAPDGMGSFHLHTLDNAFVVIGAGRALDFWKPLIDRPTTKGQYKLDQVPHEKVAEITFNRNSDGYVNWSEIKDGGFHAHNHQPIIPQCLHAVTQPEGRPQFGEYLIELK